MAQAVVDRFIKVSGGYEAWQEANTCYIKSHVQNWDSLELYVNRTEGDTSRYICSEYYQNNQFVTLTQYLQTDRKPILTGSGGELFWVASIDSVKGEVPGMQLMIAERAASHNEAYFLLSVLKRGIPLTYVGARSKHGHRYEVVSLPLFTGDTEYYFDSATGLLRFKIATKHDWYKEYTNYQWVSTGDRRRLCAGIHILYRNDSPVREELRKHIVFNRSVDTELFYSDIVRENAFMKKHLFLDAAIGIEAVAKPTPTIFKLNK